MQVAGRDIAKFQVARLEHCYVASCRIGIFLSSKLQEGKITKLEVAR